jgi:putative ABC transport system permease protein
MGLSNTLRQLGRDIRTQKLRTFLTTFGIVWGTVAISLLLAFGEGLDHQMRENAAGLGSGIVIAWPSRTSIPFEGMGKGRRIRLDEDDMALLRQQSRELGLLSSEYQDTLTLRLGPKTLAVSTSGIHPAFGEMRNIIAQQGGRFINPIDMEQKRRVVFLGDALAEQLFGGADPVGQELRLHSSPFLVVGVQKRKIQNSSYSGRDKDKALIPATTMRELAGHKWVDNFVFTASDVSRTQEATDEILGIIAAKHRFDPVDKEALGVWDTSEMARFFDTFMTAFRLFLGIVGSLTLVVGGIGVSNIMNVVVEERTREIGIKMALGARPRGVLGQFLMETIIVTALGGAAGLLITFGVCSVVPSMGMGDFIGTPQVSPMVAGVTAALLGTIGLIAGYFPARSAANLDPVVAMKT